MTNLVLLDPDNIDFPAIESAQEEPNGLLAVGGDLAPERLLSAYRRGVFPWYDENQPILWWSPNPRAVLFPEKFRLSRSLNKALRSKKFSFTVDTAFDRVIAGCAQPRGGDSGTWINTEMYAAYGRLHQLGHAHSVEVWQDGELAGGLYGICIDQVFFGESMFSRRSDASKAALAMLCRHAPECQIKLIDCQIPSDHLYRLGAECIPRQRFSDLLTQWCDNSVLHRTWFTEGKVGT